MNAQNQQNALHVKVGGRGAVIEMPNYEHDLPGPSSLGRPHSNRRLGNFRFRRHYLRKPRWPSGRQLDNSSKPYGHPYRKQMGVQYGSHQCNYGVHGVRFPTVKLTHIQRQKYHRDVKLDNMVSISDASSSIDPLINSERNTMESADGDIDTVDDKIENGSKRRTRIVESRPSLVIIADVRDDDDDDESNDEAPVRKTKGTYHIQKKRSSASKRLAMAQNASVIDSEPDTVPEVPAEPTIVRPKPLPPNRSLIQTVYGFGFHIFIIYFIAMKSFLWK